MNKADLRRIGRHLPHYFSLIGVLLFGILGFWFFSYNKTYQVAVAISVAIAYVVWGLVHHAIHKDLYLPVVIEYITVAALGLTVILSLIFRA